MTWGQQNSEAEGHAQMDYALAQGVNVFDAAELYPMPLKEETQGRTEDIIGSWFAARRNRDKVILATKVVGRTDAADYRKNKSAPDYRVAAGSVEFGAGWQKTSREQRDYLSVKRDDPSFPAPIYATLVETDTTGDYALIWSR